MRRERATFWVGAALAAVSLLALLANEGVFFDPQPTPIDLDIRSVGCGAEHDQDGLGARLVRVDIAGEDYLGPAADLVLVLDMEPFTQAGCERVEVAPSVAWRHFDNSTHYDPETAVNQDTAKGADYMPAEATAAVAAYLRNANEIRRDADGAVRANRHNFVRLIFPGAFKRVSGDAFATRLALAGAPAELSFAQRYGKVGYGSADRRRTDLTFRFAAYERIARVVTIIFATLLGIGVGAMFEASLVISTARRIEAIKRGARRSG